MIPHNLVRLFDPAKKSGELSKNEYICWVYWFIPFKCKLYHVFTR